MTDRDAMIVLEKRLACEAIPLDECGAPDCATCLNNVSAEDVLAAMAVAHQALREKVEAGS